MRWRDFAGGEMTNWGAHGVDQIQWALGMDGTGPEELWPITEAATARSACAIPAASKSTSCSRRDRWGAASSSAKKESWKSIATRSPAIRPRSPTELLKQLDVSEEERKWDDKLALWQARWHLQNWLDSLRSRQLPVADVEIGHRSISVCHLVNITRQLGRRLQWDPAAEHFVGDAEANELLSRPRRKGFELPTG